ncbi:YqjF family protein [Haloarchaeobius sp. DFWS5]|uniref:YqjF family protein n=1 Tax=Haloarchaeobius sp. DFWS5 TaxID=3446114 RepID=UPI003EBAF704
MVLPLAMGWRNLLFENYPVDPDLLSAHLPDALTVDTFDRQGWLSVVPFTNVEVRPQGVPRQLGIALPELNLRTYVTVDGEPGVYFFSLDAQGVLGVTGARLFHHLPYFYARISLTGEDGKVKFRSHRRHPGARPAHYEATYGPAGDRIRPDPDSLSGFLTERYRFYTQGHDGDLRYTDIDHPTWALYPATAEIERNTLFEADGFDHPETEPTLYYSPGVDVTATRCKRWSA